MKLWTVKMGEVTLTKPLEMAQAARFAEQLVDVAESFIDVRVEFYAETIEEAEVTCEMQRRSYRSQFERFNPGDADQAEAFASYWSDVL